MIRNIKSRVYRWKVVFLLCCPCLAVVYLMTVCDVGGLVVLVSPVRLSPDWSISTCRTFTNINIQQIIIKFSSTNVTNYQTQPGKIWWYGIISMWQYWNIGLSWRLGGCHADGDIGHDHYHHYGQLLSHEDHQSAVLVLISTIKSPVSTHNQSLCIFLN